MQDGPISTQHTSQNLDRAQEWLKSPQLDDELCPLNGPRIEIKVLRDEPAENFVAEEASIICLCHSYKLRLSLPSNQTDEGCEKIWHVHAICA